MLQVLNKLLSLHKHFNNNIMNLFSKISEDCNQLTEVAQRYLDTLPFISNDDCIERIWVWACNQMDKDEKGYFVFNGKNGLAEDIVDSGVPFSVLPKNGSLVYSLGWSVTAQDANLRSLLEFVEGRQTEWVKFKCLVDLE
jgi:hypothetical protein